MYNFDEMVDRRGSYSYKWDVADNELPMWVADMDFRVAPEIREAIEERVKQDVFGYGMIPDSWQEAYASWWRRRHGYEMDKEALIFTTGVVPAISTTVRKITEPAEKVLIQTPVYNIFFNSIFNNGRYILESPLVYKEGQYSIDWEDLEAKLSDPQTTLMILCNPHNPVGKIWDRDTLERIGQLCYKHGVVVLSDEIHCDITDPGREYIPFASVSDHCRDNSITCIAPTKAFNLAGFQTAAVYVPNPKLRHKVWRALNTDEVAEPNAFAIQVAEAAFNKGQAWLDELRQYLFENKKTVEKFIRDNNLRLWLVQSEATYLLWIDCSQYDKDSERLASFIRKETGLYLSEGSQYGESGRSFLRLNIACPRERLMDGLNRLKRGLDKC
ncbi:MAG: MalY/PatB family protein [Agathobacter sp.]|nr:MalY/PatB family protein [Agathobacter sp.]